MACYSSPFVVTEASRLDKCLGLRLAYNDTHSLVGRKFMQASERYPIRVASQIKVSDLGKKLSQALNFSRSRCGLVGRLTNHILM